MVIILYLAILFAAGYWVVKTLLPEMRKPPMPAPVKSAPARSRSNEMPEVDVTKSRVEKLEMLLAEKNKNISFLQTELRVFHIQVRDFEKVKTILEAEIHRLKEQNRIFRSELGLPNAQPKEDSSRLFL